MEERSCVHLNFSLVYEYWKEKLNSKHDAMKTWGSGCIDPCILDLGTSLR
jgi:hypothetical protein